MRNIDILLPVFTQVALTFALIVWMGIERSKAVQSKGVAIKDIALRQPSWPERTTQIGNAFHNQLELPLMFYALVALIIATANVTLPLVVLAWGYAALRIVHAYIHTGSNYVPRRALMFRLSVLVLIAMWAVFAVQSLMAAYG